MSSCFCMGPQKGEPLCPCMVRARNAVQPDDKWIVERVLGDLNEPTRRSRFEPIILNIDTETVNDCNQR